MKTIFVLVLCLYVQNCYGRYFPGHFFRFKSRGIPIIKSELRDAVCEDNPDYADGCPGFAATPDYCKDQEDFMRKNCPKSCGFCAEGTVKPPAPTACEDDTDYADGCAAHAAIPNYCTYHEDFMRKHCPKTCGFCSEVTSQPPVTTQPLASIGECKDGPSYDCKDIAGVEGLCKEQEEFTRVNCALSCGWCVTTSPAKIPAPEICEQDLPKWAHKCSEWASAGECDDPKKQIFMEHYCRKSCKLPCKPEPSPNPGTKPPAPPAFCRDRDVNCAKWKSLGLCASPTDKARFYCGVTCDICKAPIPEECYDKAENCQVLKNEGKCTSTNPTIEYEVKTNCLVTCGFCSPDFP